MHILCIYQKTISLSLFKIDTSQTSRCFNGIVKQWLTMYFIFDMILSIAFKNKCLWSIFESALFRDKFGKMISHPCSSTFWYFDSKTTIWFTWTILFACFFFDQKPVMSMDITSKFRKFQKMLYYYPCCVFVWCKMLCNCHSNFFFFSFSLSSLLLEGLSKNCLPTFNDSLPRKR